ncbi:MAG: alpha/beta fold hydrolase [Candidatus Margulisbacteria bacterium]|nr:alpha/beta fold hydrolase [Candidatus Margulisiibacteriota bacterium]
MPSEKVTFQSHEGASLVGNIELPEGTPKAYGLFAHCFTCTKNIKATIKIARALCNLGIAVLRFDFTGLGESEGDFADTNFSSNVEDLVAASKFLETTYQAPTILIGHSLGGTAVLHASQHIPSTKALVTIAAPSNPAHITNMIKSKQEDIENNGEADVLLAGRPFKIKKQFLDDLSSDKVQSSLKKLKTPILIFHSPIDNTVGIENAAELFQLAQHPKSFISLDKADHLLTNPEDSEYVAQIISTWAHKYI